MIVTGRSIAPGHASGAALVSDKAISFFGGVDPDSGIVLEQGHPLHGQSIAGRVLVFPSGKGSTVGSYTLYRLQYQGNAPAAILNVNCETITAVGCIIAGIPCVDQIQIEDFTDGDMLTVDGDTGSVTFHQVKSANRLPNATGLDRSRGEMP